jgi:alkanesulfonate monooxygenase
MPVEFIGMIHTNDASESQPQTTALLDPDFTRRHARAHEDAGFDRVLIGYGSAWPEGTQVAAHVAAHAQRLGLLIAHRPGFVFPTLAARQFATLDQFSSGVSTLLIRGYDPLEDATDYGRELIPLVRAEVARRDAAGVGVAEPGAGAELAGRS